MIVTLDGPAGAGKSTLAKALAKRLGFAFLDTGAMYRAATLAGLRAEANWEDANALAALAHRSRIELLGGSVFLNGEEVTDQIRSSQVTAHVRYMADNPAVREQMVALQREVAAGKNMVTEGRDQGTVVFPDAACKFYLTASPEERARRRTVELRQQGEEAEPAEVLRQQNERDRQDCSRPVGRLKKARDAIEVCTDGMSLEESLEVLVDAVRQRM